MKYYKNIYDNLNDRALQLRINNENRIEREIKYLYEKLDKLKLFRKKAMIDHNKFAVEKTKLIIDNERTKVDKLTQELREIRKEKDLKYQRDIDAIHKRIATIAQEYQKAKKRNDKKKMLAIEKEEDELNPRLKQLDAEYYKIRNVEKDRMKAEIDYLNKKMTDMEETLEIGNVEKNKLRMQELSRELNQKRNEFTKYSLVSMKRIIR
jgi:hypothetical protein